jgi:hypothetical protein
MAKRGMRVWILDGLVALTALVALSFLVRERVLPWIADRAVLDPGETVRDAPGLLDARDAAPMDLEADSSHLVFVFRSTCAACARAVPGWRRLADDPKWQVTAVGLEDREAAVAYASSRLAGARIAVPADLRDFTHRFRIDVVPTTLVIDRGSRLAARHVGPLGEEVIEALSPASSSPTPPLLDGRTE